MGAGAIGCFLGGELAAAGVDVIFVGRERTKTELAMHGLTLTDLDGRHVEVRRERIRYETDTASLAKSDVVLVCVKSAQTREAGESLARVLSRDAVLISMQNGVRNADVLREAAPTARVLAGIVGFNVVARGEGLFRRATTGPLVIEQTLDASVAEMTRVLRAAGLIVQLRADIRAMQWSKLLMNLNNAISALSDQPTPVLLFDPGYRRILRAVIAEALAVMRIAGIRPARIGPIPPRLYPTLLALPTPVLRVVARAQLRVDPEARSSMWEDLTRRRPTEVDHLNGEIVSLATTHGTTAPLNTRIVELIHQAESAARGSPALSARSLAQAIGLDA